LDKLKQRCIFMLNIVQDIQKEMEKDAAKGGEKKTPFIDRWIKSMLLARESDG
jgi:hypothetical protein